MLTKLKTVACRVFGQDVGPKTLKSSMRSRVVAEAIAKGPPRYANDLIGKIEDRRVSMNMSEEMLGSWQRPWLAASAELQERLELASDDRFEIEMTVAKAAMASKPAEWCRALLAITLAVKPNSVVEMGTNVGISGLYVAAGLKLNGRGRMFTMEGAPSKAALAARHFDELAMPVDVVIGDFADTLNETLDKARPVDMAFIDGFHESKATLQYHGAFKRAAAPGAILVYDDINWSEGMQMAWSAITDDADLDFALDYGAIGVVGLK